jgi:hypothetical protein
VLYDHLADRWPSASSRSRNLFGLLFALFYQWTLFATPDPTGPYHRRAYSFSKLNDYRIRRVARWLLPDHQPVYGALTAVGRPGRGCLRPGEDAAGAGRGGVLWDMGNVDQPGRHAAGGLRRPGAAEAPNFFVEIDDDAWGYSPDQLDLGVAGQLVGSVVIDVHARGCAPTAPFDSTCAYARNCIPSRHYSGLMRCPIVSYRLQY